MPRFVKSIQPMSKDAAAITPGSGTGTISVPEKPPVPRNVVPESLKKLMLLRSLADRLLVLEL